MNSKSRFVIFLDVDGVLNTRKTCVSTPSGSNIGIDEARIAILAKCIREVYAAGDRRICDS